MNSSSSVNSIIIPLSPEVKEEVDESTSSFTPLSPKVKEEVDESTSVTDLSSLMTSMTIEPKKVKRRFPVMDLPKVVEETPVVDVKTIEEVALTVSIVMPYDETIAEVLRISKTIAVAKAETSDGRIESAMKEGPFLEELKRQLLAGHPTWDIVISPPRASCDILVNAVRINLKLTDCKSSDNSVNKPSMFYSLTGQTTYPYSSNWNEFYERLANAKKEGQIKKVRDKTTEYHYLVKNKLTGDVLFKPIFDIHTYVSNPSNDLQINWKNEFTNIDVFTEEADYMKKVESLLLTLQTSVKEMIARTRVFAEADLAALLA